MTKKKCPHKAASTSSQGTAVGANSSAVLELGRRIVEELGKGSARSFLTHWVSHYVAELIERADSSSGDEKSIAQRVCVETILMLWRHRAELPDGSRPLEDLEPVFRALASLDPEDDTPRYFRQVRALMEEDGDRDRVEEWLEKLEFVDSASKELLGCYLGAAASSVTDKTREWVRLAKEAGEESEPSYAMIQFLSAKQGVKAASTKNEAKRKLLAERIARLERLIELSNTAIGEFKDQIESLTRARKPNSR